METIQSVLDNYFASWNEGFISKNGDTIKQFMSSKFNGYWAHSNIDNPEVYGYDYDINSVLKQTDNAIKSFEIVSSSSEMPKTPKRPAKLTAVIVANFP